MQATNRAKPSAVTIPAASPKNPTLNNPAKRVSFSAGNHSDPSAPPSKLSKQASQIDVKTPPPPTISPVPKIQSIYSVAINPMTDVNFIVQGKQFSAHRKILLKSECAAFFTLKLKQKEPIEIQELSADAFQALIDSIYRENLSIGPNTLFELYQFYRAQKFETLTKELEANLQSVVNWKNFSLVLRIARTAIPGTPLYQNLLTLGLQHPAYLWTRLDQIPLEFFLEILQHNHLNLASEHLLVTVIHCWLMLQPVQDHQISDRCFKHVRFGCLSEKERYYLKIVETLVSPKQWAEIQNKLSSTPKPQETFWRPRVAVPPGPARFVFIQQTTDERLKEGSRHIYWHSFQLSRQSPEIKISIYFKGEMAQLTFRFEQDDNPQHYPFKLYLDNGSQAIDVNKVFFWLQTQVQPNAPTLIVCTLKELRKGHSFASRYLAILKSRPENWDIRFTAIVMM